MTELGSDMEVKSKEQKTKQTASKLNKRDTDIHINQSCKMEFNKLSILEYIHQNHHYHPQMNIEGPKSPRKLTSSNETKLLEFKTIS